MPHGPCNVCGKTDYPNSLGDPYICPACDAGNPSTKEKFPREAFMGCGQEHVLYRFIK